MTGTGDRACEVDPRAAGRVIQGTRPWRRALTTESKQPGRLPASILSQCRGCPPAGIHPQAGSGCGRWSVPPRTITAMPALRLRRTATVVALTASIVCLGALPSATSLPAAAEVSNPSSTQPARGGRAPDLLRRPGVQNFALPLAPPAAVLTEFRPPATPYGPGHRGVDLAADAGESVLAAGAGTVVFAAGLAGRGVVSIQHSSGLRTTYEPVTPSVGFGQNVSMGQPIGTLEPGHPSCRPATCLHWGARLPNGSYLDPMRLLRQWRVRLLPWDGPP
jgi:murein DD-endopeptidase MepM/ murein hydrolase activator NlpD